MANDIPFEVIASGFQFVEAPRVDDDGTVYFSDLTGGGFYRRKPASAVDTLVPGRMWIGGAVLCIDGTLMLSGRGGLIRVDPATGESQSVLSQIDGVPIVAVNDIEADGRGGLFGGTIDFAAVLERGEMPSDGRFFHLSNRGELNVIRDGLVASNGMGFSPDGRSLYHSESTRGIWRYELSADGMPGAPELFASLDDSDGLVVDSQGCVWVACWQRAHIKRYRPDGILERTIPLPFPHVVSLAFGGADLCDLYVSTGGNAAEPGKGGIVRIRSDVPGLPTHRYG